MNDQPTMRQLPGNTNELCLEANFPATSPALLFGYFTRPDLLVQWWPQTADVEPEVGGRYQLAWPAMAWRLSGVFTEFVPGQRLAFTWQWEHQPELPVRQVTIKFIPAEKGTQLKLRHGVYGDTEVEAADRQSHVEGWTHFLPRLQEVTGQANAE